VVHYNGKIGNWSSAKIMLNVNRIRIGAIGDIKAICGNVRRIAIFGILGIAVSSTFSLGHQQGLEVLAQVPANNNPVEPNLALPRAGDAELLRTSPGQPLVPTVASPLTFTDSREWSSTRLTPITFSVEPITPVTPYIPNASPVSPARDVPGAFASDPLTAFPLYDSKTDK
jgi:hypothetical protein